MIVDNNATYQKLQLQHKYDKTNDDLKYVVQDTCLLLFGLQVC